MPSYRAPVPPALRSWEEVRIEQGTEPEEHQARSIMELTDSAPPLAGRLANFTLLPRYVTDITYELTELGVLTGSLYEKFAAGKPIENPAWAYEAVIRLLVSDGKRLIQENIELRAKLEGREGETMTPSSSGSAPSRPFFSSNPSSRSQSGDSLGALADHQQQHHSATGGTSFVSVPEPQLPVAVVDGSNPDQVGTTPVPRPFPSAPLTSTLFPMADSIPPGPSLHRATQPLGSLENPPRIAKPTGVTDPFKGMAMGGSRQVNRYRSLPVHKRANDGTMGGTTVKRNLYSAGGSGEHASAGEAIEEETEDEDEEEDLDREPSNLLDE